MTENRTVGRKVSAIDFAPIARDLRTLMGDEVREEEPLARHTSYRIGGPARVYLEPTTEQGVITSLEWLKKREIPYFILGQGTNVLVSDRGVEAVVISTARGLKDVSIHATTMSAGSGVLLTKLSHLAARSGLAGLEFAISIPGTLGGALVMNAGAHGSAMVAIVKSVRVWDPGLGVHQIPAREAEFEYRQSRFQRYPWIALAADLDLREGDREQIRQTMQHFMATRKSTQPVGEPNAGSVFKNPTPQYAGQLIEQIGAKGWKSGDAEVSTLHANFIINRGRAQAVDVLNIMRRIRCVVYQRYHIILRPEVRWIGPGEGGAGATWENLWFEEGDGLTEPCE
jgi:UDP-N-acetylmuramate dehydrogenase